MDRLPIHINQTMRHNTFACKALLLLLIILHSIILFYKNHFLYSLCSIRFPFSSPFVSSWIYGQRVEMNCLNRAVNVSLHTTK